MEMHVDQSGSAVALNVGIFVGVIFLVAGLAFLLSAAGLISVLVSGGRRRGLPHALGGLALSGLALVVVPIVMLVGRAQTARGKEFQMMALQEMQQMKDLRRRELIVPVPPPAPSPLPDPFEPIWPTKEDPLPGGHEVQMKAAYHSSGGELNLPQLLSMAGVETERAIRCVDATVVKLKNPAFRIHAFRFAEGGDLHAEPHTNTIRTVTILGRGEIRLVILCTDPEASRDSTYLELVAYFKRRLEAAKLDSW